MPRWSFTHSIIVIAAALGLTGCPPGLPDPAPVANFSAAPRTGNTGIQVSFTDLSTVVAEGPVTSWQWNFGDGARSTEPNPMHTYLSPGDFNVSLTVTSSGGSHTRTRTGYIRVNSPAGAVRIGADGGTASANGVSIAVAAGALSSNVDFGITRVNTEILFNVFETINRVGDTFRISHDSNTTNMAASTADAPIQPLELAIPYAEDVVPTGSRIPAKVQIIAQLEDGLVVPLLGKIRSGAVVASVTSLPSSALYTVVYRPDAFIERISVAAPGKVQTGVNWTDDWQISLSPELLVQLTALRLGTVQRAASFGNRRFTDAQLAATTDALEASITALQNDFEAVRARSPRLAALDGAYSLVFFNTVRTYPIDLESLSGVFYAGSPFGGVVVDPRQLLAVSTWNADRFAADPDQVDIAQKLSASQAVTEVVTRAVVDGYDYPNLTVASPADGGTAVSFAAGIREGLALYLGQMYGGRDVNRAQLEGDFALLSTPLLAPFDTQVPGYAAAGQDFFRYVGNRYEPDPALAYVGRGTGVVKGLLEEIRISLAGANNPSFTAASKLSATALDRVFFDYLEVPVGEAYLNYALDLAFEHGQDGVLRASDSGRLPLVFDESRFAEGSVSSADLETADGGADFPLPGDTSLSAIPPLTSRAVKISVNPASKALMLTFNSANWTTDTSNQGVTVVVYREGLPGTVLQGAELEFSGFEADLGKTTADFYIVIVNGSSSTSNSVRITAISSSVAPAN